MYCFGFNAMLRLEEVRGGEHVPPPPPHPSGIPSPMVSRHNYAIMHVKFVQAVRGSMHEAKENLWWRKFLKLNSQLESAVVRQ